MKYSIYLIILVLTFKSNIASARKTDVVNSPTSTIQHNTNGGNADYNDWGLLVLIGVIGFTGILSRKKQLGRNVE